MISPSERILRAAILDILCGEVKMPPPWVATTLRLALNASRDPGEHPEDRCEECREAFDPWTAEPGDWLAVTGRGWGGPIFCEPCFLRRLETTR